MNKIFLIFLFATTSAFLDDDPSWVKWKQEFAQESFFFNEKSELSAYLNFKENEQKIKIHNADPSRKFDLGLNQFSIFNQATIEKKFLGLRMPKKVNIGQSLLEAINLSGPLGNYTTKNLPKSVDHRKYYQPIQDQGACGSCWAFATGSAIGLILFRVEDCIFEVQKLTKNNSQ